jgi:hypothetical protein
MGSPTTFAIKQITGDQNLKLELRGRALPYQPLELEGSMRAETTWYPGNAVATIQMLGAEEKPTVIKGMWKDKFIKSQTDEGDSVDPTGVALFKGVQVSDTLALTQAVDKIRLQGQLLEVTWDSQVRRGILNRFKQVWYRREDVEWEMEFIWTSRGEDQSPVTLPANPSPDSFSKQIALLLGQLSDALDAADFPVVTQFTNAVAQAVTDINFASDEIANAVTNTVTQISSPLDAAARALAAAQTLQNAGATIVGVCESTPPAQLVNLPDPGDLTLGPVLGAAQFLRGVKQAARDLQLTGADQADTLRSQTQLSALLGSFIARGPVDLRDIAQQFYQTPDEWRTLLQYNDLDSSAVTPGQLILVPRLSFADGRV